MASRLGWKGLTYGTHRPLGSSDERFMPRIPAVTSEVSPPGRPSRCRRTSGNWPVCRISYAL
jgi:hypothetical protein